MAQDSNNFHVSYPDVFRHWSASCERYAGGDALVTMLMRGWTFSTNLIEYEEYWHAGTRPVTVYHFDLIRNGESMMMRVISNPYVRRVIRMHELKTVLIADKSSKRAKADMA